MPPLQSARLSVSFLQIRKALRQRIVSGVKTDTTSGGAAEGSRFFEPQFDVLLTTDAFVLRDKSFLKKIQWEYLIVDEAHRWARRDSCPQLPG